MGVMAVTMLICAYVQRGKGGAKEAPVAPQKDRTETSKNLSAVEMSQQDRDKDKENTV
eukprot:CAMPEP_0116871490 /NCGR_PEP_ID=MMETSP0463-20121206/1863_1 /TAXON_ID=181622 /ORGANISM="Strombidinopsis sp, Strain SopsisLIS2011" /LENGTH=57 /DNA_ID=CAMNT_0004510009 /DNA_START=142 /DNA_END=315 /DNA_ORIENTATION=+